MAATAPKVMSATAFKNMTTPRNPFKRYRGRNITRIDKSLERWNDVYGGRTAMGVLAGLLSACRHWVDVNRTSTSDRTTLRRTGVTMLADQAFKRLQYETFAARKESNSYSGSFQSLQGGYKHERTTYLQSGKTKAVSGSTASALVEFSGQLGIDLQGKTFNTLTLEEFKNLVSTYAPELLESEEVVFLKKQDRIGYLVVVENGVMFTGAQERFDTGGAGFTTTGHPYIIDQYGSLYTTDHVAMGRALPQEQRFNHSSFNAGKDVICAGIVRAQNGRLAYIDNNSGHYKPDRIQLLNALIVLDGCGVDLTKVRVGWKSLERGKIVVREYANARAFLTNPNMGPDETLRE